ncbi:RHS repeat-associated core domain-containing protein [Actinomadura rubrisoli]|uniref:RHS repeat-associated core domain-containing protein n=1 Tax=Actinomadura rubrisoli TaxID=2530368 RepID=A0A4V2YW03_9ACTN|nr:RHS repeat-associated core domain-containing protein [Actinomadura rubrisoli]
MTATERGFLGRTEDPTTDLVALDHRYYDAAIGRFINPDPLANPESLNPYSYAQNNPTSDSDYPTTPTPASRAPARPTHGALPAARSFSRGRPLLP